jgi:hypothetical protein
MMIMNRLLSISKLLAVILVFAACKKNTGEPVATTPTETATGSPASANAIKDSTLLLTKGYLSLEHPDPGNL